MDRQLKFYIVMGVSLVSNVQKCNSPEKRFSKDRPPKRAVKSCDLSDHLGDEDIRKHLKMCSVLNRIKENRRSWKSRAMRMVCTRLPKQLLNYSSW